MSMNPLRVGLCGFGGQGIILSAVVLGTTAVTKRGMYAVQTQSYGSEARGGQCQAELILSEKPINSPTVQKKDILICLFQTAVDRYLPTLKEGGVLIIDPNLVTSLPKTTAQVFEVPATEIAIGLGNRLAANMVVLGFIQEATGLMTRDDLVDVVKSLVSERFWDLDVRAIDAGIEHARSHGAKIDLEALAA
jgi:2-oxoglutarate ferredoxin oxidoreductase subunit gamma